MPIQPLAAVHKKPYIIMSMCVQSAAGLCVGIGSFCDPTEIPGLAHFLEHSQSNSLTSFLLHCFTAVFVVAVLLSHPLFQ